MNLAKYVFMHRNDEAAILEINQEDGYLFDVLEKKDENLIPIRANKSKADFRGWWRDRAVPKTQGSILAFLREYDIPTTQSYLLKNLGLSLDDHYWVRPIKQSLTWEQVNLFTNDFTHSLSFHHQRQSGDAVTSFSPAASTGGELPKQWIIENGKRWLVKDSDGPLSQQSINEVFATELHEKQGRFPFVTYSLVRKSGTQKLSCRCELFTSERYEFIPAWDLIGQEQLGKNEPLFDNFVKACVAGGLQEESVRSYLDYQIVSDFIISNVDRHLKNFGVLRNTQSLDFVSMAPLFDSGNSMFYKDPSITGSWDAVLNLRSKGFYTTERKYMEHVRDYGCLDISKLPDTSMVQALYEKDQGLKSAGFNKYIAIGYEQKVSVVRQLQRGISLGKVYSREQGRSR